MKKRYFLVQDQSTRYPDHMFFISEDENIEKQFTGYRIWRKSFNKKELEVLAKKLNEEFLNEKAVIKDTSTGEIFIDHPHIARNHSDYFIVRYLM